EFPDYESDKAVGKNNLVVVLGRPVARYGYALLVWLPFVIVAAGVMSGELPRLAALALLSLPMVAYSTWVTFTRYEQRELVNANKYTIFLHSTFGLLLALGLGLS
ncbi:MAG: hypothetical protein ACO3JL_17540, partial [Myxococcota bacterium]